VSSRRSKVAFLCGIPWASGAKEDAFLRAEDKEGGIEHSIVQMSFGWVDLTLFSYSSFGHVESTLNAGNPQMISF